MATLKEYYATDFSHSLCVDYPLQLRKESENIDVLVKIGLEKYSDSKYIVFYIISCDDIIKICQHLLRSREELLKKINDVEIHSSFISDIKLGNFGTKFSVVTNKIYFYIDGLVNDLFRTEIDQLGREMNLSITIRDNTYLEKKIELEKPIAFISHDSRDKEKIALPIALEFQNRLCPVWYDEFSLKIGDSLCDSIDKGIKEAKKCILILSRHFLNNSNWTKEEFRLAFTKERINQGSTILPIWVDVTKEEVYDYHATLADKIAIKWDANKEDNVSNIVNKLMFSINPQN